MLQSGIPPFGGENLWVVSRYNFWMTGLIVLALIIAVLWAGGSMMKRINKE
jgi:hypothetical protein